MRSLQEESNRVIKEGPLLKNSPQGFRLRWQKRWFRLTGEELLYYENKASREASGAIALTDIQRLIPTDDVIEQFVFEIELKTSGRDSYRLSAEDSQTQREWMHAIQSAIELRASRQTQRSSGHGAQDLPQRTTIRPGGDPTRERVVHGAAGLSAGQHIAPARGDTNDYPAQPEPETEPDVAAPSGSVLSRNSSSGSLRSTFSLSQTSSRQQPTELRSSLLGVQAGMQASEGLGGFVVDEPDDTL